MPEVHSHLGASSSHRWLNCPGSVRLYRQLKTRKTTSYALTGTLAHLVCELSLRQGLNPSDYLGKYLALGDGKNAGQVTEEIVESTSVYVELIRRDLKEFGGTLVVEQSFDLSWVYPGMFGTNDASIIPDKPFGTLRTYDYKNGRMPVEAKDNPQLQYYMLGALGEKNLSFAEFATGTIVQPNLYNRGPFDSFGINVPSLYQWAMDVLRPGAKRAMEDPEAPIKEGDWCCFCEAAAFCPLRQQRALAVLGDDVDVSKPAMVTLPPVKMLSPERIGMLSAFFQSEAFTSWVKALAAEEQAALARGEVIPGRKLVETVVKGNRKWADEAAVIAEFKGLLGEELFNEKLKSPAQLEKVLSSRKLDKSMIGAFVTRDESVKTIVVNDDDDRPSVEERRAKAIELF